MKHFFNTFLLFINKDLHTCGTFIVQQQVKIEMLNLWVSCLKTGNARITIINHNLYYVPRVIVLKFQQNQSNIT